MVPRLPQGTGLLTAVAVSGAGGYLGGRLVQRLPDRARALVRAEQPFLRGADQRVVDLTGPVDAIVDALDGVETVVHLAGQNEVASANDPDGALAATVAAARRLGAAAERAGVRRVVYASTVHVYGTRLRPGTEIDESVTPEPVSTYAIARLACEHVLGALASSGIEVVVLRLTNVVGAPVDVAVDRWTLVTNDLCRQAVTTGRLELRSSGQQHRDFVAAADVEEVLLGFAVDRTRPAGTYNVGSGQPTTIRDLARTVQDRIELLTGRRPELVAPEPDGPPDEPYRVVLERLRAAGFRTDTPLTAAVDEVASFCLAREDELTRSSNRP